MEGGFIKGRDIFTSKGKGNILPGGKDETNEISSLWASGHWSISDGYE